MIPTPEDIEAAQAEHKRLCAALQELIKVMHPQALTGPDDLESRELAIVMAALTDLLAGSVALAIASEPDEGERTLELAFRRLAKAIPMYEETSGDE